MRDEDTLLRYIVLNLIINGLPSIPKEFQWHTGKVVLQSFKPYYKWITFNTGKKIIVLMIVMVKF